MSEKDSIKINFGKLFPNKPTLIFSILFFISLFINLLSVLKISFGIPIMGQFLSIFPSLLLWTLSLALAISAILAYFKKFKFMFLPIIIWLLLTSVIVRTPNIAQLKDITTGEWTLAPDLDPFLYLRLAQNINDGTLQNPDVIRYAPIGAKNYALQNLMPLTIFSIYKIMSIFKETSLTYAAIITPVILFFASCIGFLLFVKVLGSLKFSKKKSWLFAIIATLFYIFIPAMLHRTVAGVPEIESLGLVWFWLAFLFFVMAWKEIKSKKIITYGILSGIFTGLMSWSWGGYRYIYMVIGLTTLLIFLFQKDRIKNRKILLSWVIPALLIVLLQTKNIQSLLTSMSDTGFGFFVLFLILIDFILFDTKLKNKIKIEKINFPRSIVSSVIGILILVLVLLIFEPNFLINAIKDIFERLLYPFGRARVGLTVAENRVPYLIEILQRFGSFLWVFVIGTIVIFYEAFKKFKLKQKMILNGFFILFILGAVFSKYSPTSILNGVSFFSKLIYMGGLLVFGFVLLYTISKAHVKKDEKILQNFKEINFLYIFLLVLSFWAIISMKGAIRLFFIISPIIILISSFLFVNILDYKEKNKNNSSKKLTALIVLGVLIIILAGNFVDYSIKTVSEAKNTVPGIYEKQWQSTMAWVRENTIVESIFVHWWDYGYWIQTLGERATVTDGGHFIGYWPHLIGRYVLTTPYPETALSFMKSHNVSHLLIDSTDLGKYSAYSSIGSDETGVDRLSQIPIMNLDPNQINKNEDKEIRVYQGGVFVDEDIIYEQGDQKIFLPATKAAIAGVIIEFSEKNKNLSFSQARGIFVYNNQQMIIPIRYIYFKGELIDLGGGLNAAVQIIPSVSSPGQNFQIDNLGAVIYLSPKVYSSLFTQLYLMNDPLNKYPTIKPAHFEQDPLILNLRVQGADIREFLYYGGFRGPIKIWKVNYPVNILAKEEFLRTEGEFAEFDDLKFIK